MTRFQQQPEQPTEPEPVLLEASAPAMPNFTQQETRFQPEEISEKLAQLQAQAAEIDDPQWAANGFDKAETFAELNSYAKSFVSLEKVPEGTRHEEAAYNLANKHLMAYTDYQGSPYELEMAEIIADGMKRDDRYRLTIESESSDGVELAIIASEYGRDLEMVDKESHNPVGADLAISESYSKIREMFGLKPDTHVTMENLSAKNAANHLESIKPPSNEIERKEASKVIVERLGKH